MKWPVCMKMHLVITLPSYTFNTSQHYKFYEGKRLDESSSEDEDQHDDQHEGSIRVYPPLSLIIY